MRELREVSGIAPEAMAAELGLEPAAYLQLESGREDISVGTLSRIAHRCNTELVTLITGEEPRLHSFALTRKAASDAPPK